jgi:hypothetical protein
MRFNYWGLVASIQHYGKHSCGISLYLMSIYFVGRDSADGIVIRNGLDGPGIKSRLGRYFSHLFGAALGSPQSSV